MNNVSERIYKVITEKGLSYGELAKATGIPKSALQRYATGETEKIPLDRIKAIAKATGVAAEYLMGWENESEAGYLTDKETVLITKYRECDESGKEMVDRVLDYEYHRSQRLNIITLPPQTKIIDFPVYTQPASAGLGYYLDGDDTCSNVQIPIIDIPHGADFGLYIQGDSMEPKYPNGSIVFVKSQPAIEPGEIGIFALDRESLCKKLIVDYDKPELRLVSLNPKYKPIVVDEHQTLHTYGKVLGCIKM